MFYRSRPITILDNAGSRKNGLASGGLQISEFVSNVRLPIPI
jgi:hypothetical protein